MTPPHASGPGLLNSTGDRSIVARIRGRQATCGEASLKQWATVPPRVAGPSFVESMTESALQLAHSIELAGGLKAPKRWASAGAQNFALRNRPNRYIMCFETPISLTTGSAGVHAWTRLEALTARFTGTGGCWSSDAEVADILGSLKGIDPLRQVPICGLCGRYGLVSVRYRRRGPWHNGSAAVHE